jgi:hypothetical protein
MNREDIIRMVHKAYTSDASGIDFVFSEEELMNFARLIAEDCAKRCEAVADGEELPAAAAAADRCGRVIREAYKP